MGRIVQNKIIFVRLFSAARLAFFFFQAEAGIRDLTVTGVQTCALPISQGVADHIVVDIDLPPSAASALTNRAIDVPRHALSAPGVPVTYVPARNMIFLAYEIGRASCRERV